MEFARRKSYIIDIVHYHNSSKKFNKTNTFKLNNLSVSRLMFLFQSYTILGIYYAERNLF